MILDIVLTAATGCRPEAQIVAMTTNPTTFQRLALYWGVLPLLIEPAATTDEMFSRIEDILREQKLVKPGEQCVISMGVPIGSGESTNLLKIHNIA